MTPKRTPAGRPTGTVPWRRALGAALGAGAVLAGAGAIVTAGPVGPAGAVTRHYVGIVISGEKSACVRWHSGITGDEVLNDVASVNYRQDGLIVQIGGVPSPPKADSTHYWSYWHNTGSGWTYSSVGASNYAPKAGTVEGWRYVNGSKASAPGGGSYATLCGKLDTPPKTKKQSTPARPEPHATHVPAATAHRRAIVAGTRVGAPATPAAGPATTAVGTPTSGAPASGPRASAKAAGSAAPSRAVATSAAASSSTAANGVVVVSGSPVADQRHVASGSAWPTVLGGLLALGVGGAALTTTVARRRAARR